jgi:hypothetical protein
MSSEAPSSTGLLSSTLIFLLVVAPSEAAEPECAEMATRTSLATFESETYCNAFNTDLGNCPNYYVGARSCPAASTLPHMRWLTTLREPHS